jgi:hypothetical protein
LSAPAGRASSIASRRGSGRGRAVGVCTTKETVRPHHRTSPCGSARLDFTDLRCHPGLHDEALKQTALPLTTEVPANTMHSLAWMLASTACTASTDLMTKLVSPMSERCSTLSVDVTSPRMRMSSCRRGPYHQCGAA